MNGVLADRREGIKDDRLNTERTEKVMNIGKQIRYVAIAAILLLGVYWSASSATSGGAGEDYPNAGFLATAEWLKSQKDDASLVIVDVRMDKYFEGKLIPGAIRMPWRQFQYDDVAGNMGGL